MSTHLDNVTSAREELNPLYPLDHRRHTTPGLLAAQIGSPRRVVIGTSAPFIISFSTLHEEHRG